jgi:Cft2 family RNA processing exonuclease
MTDKISFSNKEDIQKIMAQTTYDETQAIEKLMAFNNDYIKVIRDYMGIPEKKERKVTSINQEIFRQIRTNLDSSMKNYRDKHPIDMNQLIENLNESDKREIIKNNV